MVQVGVCQKKNWGTPVFGSWVGGGYFLLYLVAPGFPFFFYLTGAR